MADTQSTADKAKAYADGVLEKKKQANQLLSELDLERAYLNGYEQGELDVAQRAAKSALKEMGR